jgi:hypothetical protein
MRHRTPSTLFATPAQADEDIAGVRMRPEMFVIYKILFLRWYHGMNFMAIAAQVRLREIFNRRRDSE